MKTSTINLDFFPFVQFYQALEKNLPKDLEIITSAYISEGYIVLRRKDSDSIPFTVYVVISDPSRMAQDFEGLIAISQNLSEKLRLEIHVGPHQVATVTNSFWLNSGALLEEDFLDLLQKLTRENAGFIPAGDLSRWLQALVLRSELYTKYLNPTK